MIREVPFCPYLDSPPDFSFGENGENCLDGAITVTGHVCVNSNKPRTNVCVFLSKPLTNICSYRIM